MNVKRDTLRQSARLVLAGAAALGLLATSAAAQPYSALSNKHTLHGVSQLWAGDGQSRRNVAIRLDNPSPRTHVAVAIVYDRENEIHGGTAELFRGCTLRTLTPHTSLMVDSDDPAFEAATNDEHYAEVIAVPRSPVPGLGRVADGLGIIVEGGGGREYANRPFRALNPMLFNGADRSVNSANAVRDCICSELAASNLPLTLFEDTGITCPVI